MHILHVCIFEGLEFCPLVVFCIFCSFCLFIVLVRLRCDIELSWQHAPQVFKKVKGIKTFEYAAVPSSWPCLQWTVGSLFKVQQICFYSYYILQCFSHFVDFCNVCAFVILCLSFRTFIMLGPMYLSHQWTLCTLLVCVSRVKFVSSKTKQTKKQVYQLQRAVTVCDRHHTKL